MSYAVNVAGPTYVFSPTSALTNVLRLQNLGSSTLYVGGLNQLNLVGGLGLPLLSPGGKVLELVFPPSTQPTVYVSAGYSAGTAAATIGTGGAGTVGTTKLTVTTLNSSFAPGSVLQLGNGSNQEYVTVASTATTIATLSVGTQLYHPVGDPMTLVTSVIGQLGVNTGAH